MAEEHIQRAKRAAKTRLAKDPEAFKTMGAKGGKNTTFRSFRDIPGLAKKAASKSRVKRPRK